MSWPWRRRRHFEPAVSDADRAHLEQARRDVADQQVQLSEQVGEAASLGRYLRRQRDVENHLAERFRTALGGGGG